MASFRIASAGYDSRIHLARIEQVAVAGKDVVCQLADERVLKDHSDAVYGVAATVLLVVGLLRVFYTEKGAAYYFASFTFLAKLALFVVVGILSIYPTIKFLG